ncbi:MAG: hypothetical protein LBL24_06785 [Bacteroidales bacterium]|jgi:hypothetical protein|nr:hypothetical protein [Bacteroidales bacterium]
MSSTSETGHARNVGNLRTLIVFVESLGEKYRPGNSIIRIDTLNNLAHLSNESIKAVNAAEVSYIKAVGSRQAAFKPLSKLASRIVNALVSSNPGKRTVDAATALNRKISGRSLAKKAVVEKETLEAGGKPAGRASTSQMSYDMRIENFNKLILLLRETPQYAPNEEDLTVSALQNLIESLAAENNNVARYSAPLVNLRIRRNAVIYAPEAGIPDSAMAVKSYIKSIYGASSAEYKTISKLKFTRN